MGFRNHLYDSTGRPDEAIDDNGTSLSLDQWIDLLKTDWPTNNNSLFCMDEYAVMDVEICLSIGSAQTVMGLTQLSDTEDGSTQPGLMDWWNGYCDMTKEAVIFASRGVFPIFQNGLVGDHGTTNGQELALNGFAASGNGDLTRGPYPRISAWAAVWHQLKGLSFVSQAASTNGIISYTFASGGSTNVFRRGAEAGRLGKICSSAQDCVDVFGNAEHTSLWHY